VWHRPTPAGSPCAWSFTDSGSFECGHTSPTVSCGEPCRLGSRYSRSFESVGTLCPLRELQPFPALSPALGACGISRNVRCLHSVCVGTHCPLRELRLVPPVSPAVEACRSSRIVRRMHRVCRYTLSPEGAVPVPAVTPAVEACRSSRITKSMHVRCVAASLVVPHRVDEGGQDFFFQLSGGVTTATAGDNRVALPQRMLRRLGEKARVFQARGSLSPNGKRGLQH
jgi:hypothetical protein